MSPYFKVLNIEDSRMILRSNLRMVKTIRNNFRSNKKYKAEHYQCPDCVSMGIIPAMTDTQEHVLTTACVANSDLRQNRDFTRDEEVCEFFRELIDRRVERYGC